MKKNIRVFYCLLTVFTGFLLSAATLPADDYRKNLHRLREDQVWEPEIQISEDTVIPGFWRPRARSGYEWVKATKDEAGRWHPGYWAPLHRDILTGKTDLPGYWGPENRTGYIWINVEDRVGDYPAGSWEPMNTYQVAQPPLKWVPGYWTGRRWVPGYWRIPEREGHIWFEGYYGADGRWNEAHWGLSPEEIPPAPE